jgi:multiple sugar transport system ATP-binding protein
MSAVSVENVHKVYQTASGPLHAVKGVNLECKDGETLAVLGPSGCGKSSLMRMIAGLEQISGGQICIDGKVVNDIPAEQRNVSLAFENYALYPAMTVQQNLEFPLINFGQHSKSEIQEEVNDIVDYFRLRDVLNRKPAELSGGHAQMVSLGRALIKSASVHILDEPLSHLDLQFRNEVVAKLRSLQRERGLSMILITHDQEEALELADRVTVMNEGLLQQIGTPDDIVGRPANLFVADFVGDPPMNIIPCRFESGTEPGLITDGGNRFPAPESMLRNGGNGEYLVGLRPTELSFVTDSSTRYVFDQPLSITLREELGEATILSLDFEGQIIRLAASRRDEIETSTGAIRVGYDREAMHIFDRQTGLRVE